MRNATPLSALALGLVTALLTGCAHNNPSQAMAPPTTPVTISQPGYDTNGGSGGQMTQAGGQMAAPGGQSQPYNWTEVPVGQQVPVSYARFDQTGYQIYAQSGETIVVPFVNQNMYVMKFGQSTNGGTYFINDGTAPSLYLPPGGSLENASAQGARWYPFPQNFAYSQPVYMGLAPTWSDYVGMGWYPGMSYWGGYYGYHPYGLGYGFVPMVGLHFLIGGHPYYGYGAYHSYYVSHPYNRSYTRNVYHYNGSSFRTGGSAYSNRRTFGSSTNAFGGGRTGSFSTGGTRRFGQPGGSFGSGRPAFGSGTRRTGGSFGSGPSGTGGSFGAGRNRSFGSSSFGGGGSRPFGSSASPRPFTGGGSFGGGGSSSSPRTFGGGSFDGGSTRSYGGGSFGGGSHSFGGGSFGGGHSSFGGFGRRR